jgi:hypothetical protein
VSWPTRCPSGWGLRSRRPTRVPGHAPRRAALVAGLLLLGSASGSGARVFHSRQEALVLAFPGADRVEARTFVLDDAQTRAVEALARLPVETRLVTWHTGYAGGRVLGHAWIDVHTVRTHPEALLVLLSPEGEVRRVLLLAFHEPEEYLPPERWLRGFEGRRLDEDLRLGRDVDGISGATLTSRAVTASVRRALALHRVLMRGSGSGE